MKYPEELTAVAQRIIWFESAEQALEVTEYFLTYLMTYGTEEDIEIARKYYSDADFEATLKNPTPGIFFRDSWIKWNLRYNRTPVPSMPKRRLPGVDPETIPDLFPAKSYRLRQ
jgi:hypothetical protein